MKKTSLLLVCVFCALFIPTIGMAEITDSVEILHGHVTVTQVGASDLLVTVDLLPRGGDGIVDEAFIYRSDAALPDELDALAESAQVVVRPHSIVIRWQKGPSLRLVVPTAEGRAPLKRRNTLTVDSGYQLSRLHGGEGAELIATAYNLLQPAQVFDLAKAISPEEDSGNECISGGPGATSCSIAGGVVIVGSGGNATCSVTCGAGYHACCKGTGCSCVKGS